jgi:dimeric dUTPase (all-alpha-NTP-PPase superfamily)
MCVDKDSAQYVPIIWLTLNVTVVEQANMQISAPFDNQDIHTRIILAQCMHQVKILNRLILKRNISLRAPFEDHCTIVDMLHPTFFCKINELAKHNSSLNQSCIYRLFILLIVLKN